LDHSGVARIAGTPDPQHAIAALQQQLDAALAREAALVCELRALEEVLRAVNSSLDLETVLTTIIDRAVALAQADEGMIYEVDTDGKTFRPKATVGMTADGVAATPGGRALLAVPLLHEERVIGGLLIRRHREGSFAAGTAALMQSFAAQCVLAISHARLVEAARTGGATAAR